MIANPITGDVIHTIYVMFVGNTDLYCWEESLKVGEELFKKIQEEKKCLGKYLDCNRRMAQAGKELLVPG